jgi:HEAT repeat protein
MNNGEDDSETPEDATHTSDSEPNTESEAIDASENEEETENDASEETETEEETSEADSDETEEVEAEEETSEETEADTEETSEETEADTEETSDEEVDIEEKITPESLSERLEEVEGELEAAETESDLDRVEASLDSVAEDVETLPEPEDEEDTDEDEEEENPRVQLEERIDGIRDAIEEERGPYASDVVESLESAETQITDTRWTDPGESDVVETVESFLGDANDALGSDVSMDDRSIESCADAISDTIDAIESADLDPDEDAETIDHLVEATDELQSGLDDAQEWDDLTIREKLSYQGFYDVLTSENRKDFPPELSVVRIAESENNPETILLALDKFTSEFMEENCIDALRRMGPEEAFEEMNQRAQKRNNATIEVLGKIGNDRALETLLPYIEGDSDPGLQKVTLKAIGEIGSDEATQTVADRLVADEPAVRSAAARALGRIGDTRAIDPLSDLLADDESDTVRTSAAWALNQIGTRRALEAASEYADDRSYIVQAEAERAEKATTEDAGETEQAA